MNDLNSGLLKKYILPLQKIWCFKWILLTVAIPKNHSTPNKAKLNNPEEQLFGERAVLKVTFTRANVWNCSSKKFTKLNE